MTSYLEAVFIRTAGDLEKRCRSSSDSDTDSTVISNTDGSQHVESDQWDFEETIGDKISDGNAFGGIGETNRFESCVSDSEEEGRSVTKYENAGHMITSARWGLVFRFNWQFTREGFCIN